MIKNNLTCKTKRNKNNKFVFKNEISVINKSEIKIYVFVSNLILYMNIVNNLEK